MKTFIRSIGRHLANWAEAYLWVPFFLLWIVLSGVFVKILTNRPVQENVDWLVDYSGVAYKAILIVLFTSIGKQAFGSWMTKEEKLAHPVAHFINSGVTLLIFYGFLNLFSH